MIKLSTPFASHSSVIARVGKKKYFSAFRVVASYLCQPDSWIWFYSFDPLRYSPIEQFVELLELHDLLIGAPKYYENYKTLRLAKSPPEISGSGGLRSMLEKVRDNVFGVYLRVIHLLCMVFTAEDYFLLL